MAATAFVKPQHCFAVCRRPIPPSVLSPVMLDAYLDGIKAKSPFWVTSSQCGGFFNTKIMTKPAADPAAGIDLKLSELNMEPLVTPLAELRNNIDVRSLLKSHPLPSNVSFGTPLLLKDNTWTPLPKEYRTFASFAYVRKEPTDRPLFLSRRFDSFPMETAVVKLYNAQEAVNPFAMDDALAQIDEATGSRFPAQVESGLTTLRVQCEFVSHRWLVESDIFRFRYSPLKGEKSNCAVDHVATTVFNVASLQEQDRSRLLSLTPKWVKEKTRPFYRMINHWRPFIGFTSDQNTKHMPAEMPTSAVGYEHLWVTEEDLIFLNMAVPPKEAGYSTSLQMPERYFNLSQLTRS